MQVRVSHTPEWKVNPKTSQSDSDTEIQEQVCEINRKKTLNRITPTVI